MACWLSRVPGRLQPPVHEALSAFLTVLVLGAASSPAGAAEWLLHSEADPAPLLESLPRSAPALVQAPLYRDHLSSLGWSRLESDAPRAELEQLLQQRLPEARLVPVRQYRLHDEPSAASNWGLGWVNAAGAWAASTGEGITLAVIDTGIEPGHPALREALWHNPAEDLDGDGVLLPDGAGGWMLDPADLNGIDEDGNGFVDDLLGWDFTDAPPFPAPGDYLQPDNEPWDEHGHGTLVAGLAAGRDPEQELWGLAPGCRLLPLRAGNSLGWLQEDDVAAALLYAADAGARVVNMSFGDSEAGALLEDVIRHLHARGVVLVASSGNTGTEAAHWPSGFPEVLSVGGARLLENPTRVTRSLGSSWGPGLDLLAPGHALRSSDLGGGEGWIGGTSAAAPFVSAACALLLAREPSLSPEQLRSRLRRTARDMGPEGWDAEHGAGLLDAAAALADPAAPGLVIHRPASGSAWTPQAFAESGIRLSAWGDLFQSFELLSGDSPQEAELLLSSNEPWFDQVVYNDELLAPLDPPVDQLQHLWLRLRTLDGEEQLRHSSFLLDGTPPVIQDLRLEPIRRGMQELSRLEVVCDEPVRLRVTGAGVVQEGDGLSRTHAQVLDSPAGGMLDIRLRNAAGLETLHHHAVPPTGVFPAGANMGRVPSVLPEASWLDEALDLDGDQAPEVAVAFLNDGEPDSVRFMEYNWNGTFSAAGLSLPPAFPFGAGDVTGDERTELLLGLGDHARLFAAGEEHPWPSQLLQEWPSHFAAGLVSLWNDQPSQILLQSAERAYQLWLWSSEGSAAMLWEAENPDAGQATPQGRPRGIASDLDADGEPELWLSHDGGLLYSVDRLGRTRQILRFPGWRGPGEHMQLLREASGVECLAVLLQSPAAASESMAGGERARLLLLCDENGEAVVRDSLDFDLSHSGSAVAMGLAAFPRLDSGEDLLLSLAPLLYAIEWHAVEGWGVTRMALEALGGGEPVMLSSSPGGLNSILAHGVQQSLVLHTSHGAPVPPVFLPHSRPLGQDRVLLAWNAPARTYSLLLLGGVDGQLLLENLPPETAGELEVEVTPGEEWQFSFMAFSSDGMNGVRNDPPLLLGGEAPSLPGEVLPTYSGQWTIRWDPPLALEQPYARARIVQEGDSLDATLIVAAGGSETLLSLPRSRPVPEGESGLLLEGLRMPRGLRMEPLHLSLLALENGAGPRILAGRALAPTSVRLSFSKAILREDLEELTNWSLADGRELRGLQAVEQNQALVLQLAEERPLLSGTPALEVLAGQLRAEDGSRSENQRIVVRAGVGGIHELVVYPNPWRASGSGAEGAGGVVFAGTTPGTEVRIYSLEGRLLRKLREEDADASLRWDLRRQNGEDLPSGVYLFVAEDAQKQLKRGKLALVR